MGDAPVQQHTICNPPEAAPEPTPYPLPNGDGSFVVVKEGYRVHPFPGPRARRRQHVFDDLRSFAEYLNRHASVRERAEILVQDTRIVAALDPKSPIGDLPVCDLVCHPRFAAWDEAFKARQLTQRQFFALVRAHRDDITDPILAQQLLASVQSVTLVKGGERKLEIDAHGMTRFVGDNGTRKVAGEFPPFFSIRVPVFEGVCAVGLVLDVEPGTLIPARGPASVMLPGGATARFVGPAVSYDIELLLWIEEAPSGEVVFTLQAPMLDLVLRQARRDAAAYLASMLEPGLLVGLGQYLHEDVPAGTTRGPRED